MQKSINLLERAIQRHPVSYWSKRLKLARTTLHSSIQRGNLSPSIAGALAEELGEPVEHWMLVAALEGDRDSACRDRMLRRISTKGTTTQALEPPPSFQ